MMNGGQRAAMQLNPVDGDGFDTSSRLIKNQSVRSDQTISRLRSPASDKKERSLAQKAN